LSEGKKKRAFGLSRWKKKGISLGAGRSKKKKRASIPALGGGEVGRRIAIPVVTLLSVKERGKEKLSVVRIAGKKKKMLSLSLRRRKTG